MNEIVQRKEIFAGCFISVTLWKFWYVSKW